MFKSRWNASGEMDPMCLVQILRKLREHVSGKNLSLYPQVLLVYQHSNNTPEQTHSSAWSEKFEEGKKKEVMSLYIV